MQNSQLIRVRKQRVGGFTIIDNGILFDKRISSKALRLFAAVMAQHPAWQFSILGLTKILPEGTFAIRRALQELKEAGYVTQTLEGDGELIFTEAPDQRAGVADSLQVADSQVADSLLKQGKQVADSLHPQVADSLPYKIIKNKIKNKTKTESETGAPAELTGTAGQEDQAPKRTRKLKPAKTTIPGDFEITPAMREWAAKKVPTLDIDHEFDEFVDRCRAKGYEYADWEAGWKTQMRNQVKWGVGKLLPQSPPPAAEKKPWRSANGVRLLSDVIAEQDRAGNGAHR